MNFVCENCGGNLEFDIKSQKFCCSSCHTPGIIEVDNPHIQEHDFNQYHIHENNSRNYNEFGQIYCSNCGAEIIFAGNKTAVKCPMCSSPHIDTQKQISGVALDGIIPFKIDKHQAQEKFRKWIKGLWFAPNKMKKSYQEGRLEGIYLPFWTFDAEAEASYSGEGGTHYVSRGKDGKTTVKVRWTHVNGCVSRSFDDIQVCSAQTEANEIIDKILPFGTIDMTIPYSPAYLSGFSAEKYAVKADSAFVKVKKKIDDEMRGLAKADILKHFDEARIHSCNIKYRNVTYKNLLLPTWISSFGYSGKSYLYIINGETGAVGGKRPYSAVKIAAAIIAALLITGILYFIGSAGSDSVTAEISQDLCADNFSDFNISESSYISYNLEFNDTDGSVF